MQIADRRHPVPSEEEDCTGDPGPLRRPADGKCAFGHGTSTPRAGAAPTEEVWLFGLAPATRGEIAAALEDWGFVPVALDGDPSTAPGGTPSALVVDVKGLPPAGLPRELTSRSRSSQVPVVALDEGLQELGRLDGLRAFSHVLVLPCRDASTVVGALEWVVARPSHRRRAPRAARGRAPSTRGPA